MWPLSEKETYHSHCRQVNIAEQKIRNSIQVSAPEQILHIELCGRGNLATPYVLIKRE